MKTVTEEIMNLLTTNLDGQHATASSLSLQIGSITENEALRLLMKLQNIGMVRCAPGTLGSSDIVWSRC